MQKALFTAKYGFLILWPVYRNKIEKKWQFPTKTYIYFT